MPVLVLALLVTLLFFAPSVVASEFGLFGESLPTPTPTPDVYGTPSYGTPGYGTPSYGTPSGDGGGDSSGGSGGGVASDINSSGKVDIFDLSILLGSWNKAGKGDINSSGVVDIFDLSILLSAWTK